MTAAFVLKAMVGLAAFALGIFSVMLASFFYRHRTQILLAERARARRIVERRMADLKAEEDCAEEERQQEMFAGARR